LFIAFWVGVVALLLFISVFFEDTNTAIVAQVEPLKSAISYHKAVRVLEIYVIPGQKVVPGDVLVKVERPDLILDVDRKKNQLNRLKIEQTVVEQKYSEKQKMLTLEKEAKVRELTAERAQLQIIVENNQKLTNQFSNLTGYADTIRSFGKSYYEVELEALNQELDFILEQYRQNRYLAAQLYEQETKTIAIREKEIEQELQALIDEEFGLVKKAEFAGTIGSVNAQEGELLSPYSTILSLYDLNPTVIKAIMNEGYKYQAEVGQVVIVESTNRSYHIEGKIIEIGARIIEYPNRLKTNQNVAMWGQELFIKIPEQNDFLNGERVFVNIKQ
jgi:multidrug resistance efflux pump